MSQKTRVALRNPFGKAHWSLLLLLILVCGVVGFLLRPKEATLPPAIGKVNYLPHSVSRHKNSWFWLQKEKNVAKRLVALDSAGIHTLVEAEELSRYLLSDDALIWGARQGKTWTIYKASLNGRDPRILWSGAEEPIGLNIVQGRLYWLHHLPSPIPDSGPFPPLLPMLEILSLTLDGGIPQPAGRIPEAESGEVLGLQEGSLYVSAYRTSMPVKHCVYRVPSNGSPAVRVVGESGYFPAMIMKDGSLYWIGYSDEVTPENSATCVKRLDKSGKPEILLDWLPGQGRLFETSRGILYANIGPSAQFWQLGNTEHFPEPVSLPKNFVALGAGEDALLISHSGLSFTDTTLYQVPLP